MSRRYRKYQKENSYTIIATISCIIRQFVLPNPFTNMFEPGIAELANLICGGFLITLAYYLTRTWYKRKKGEYWKGSLGFLINFIILNDSLLLISKFITNIYWIIGLFLVLYIILYIIEAKLFNKNSISF